MDKNPFRQTDTLIDSVLEIMNKKERLKAIQPFDYLYETEEKIDVKKKSKKYKKDQVNVDPSENDLASMEENFKVGDKVVVKGKRNYKGTISDVIGNGDRYKVDLSKSLPSGVKVVTATKETISLDESKKFTSSMIAKLKSEFGKINKIDPSSPTYDKLIDLLDDMDDETLKQVAKSDIKFVSKLAQNRVKRRGLNESYKKPLSRYSSKTLAREQSRRMKENQETVNSVNEMSDEVEDKKEEIVKAMKKEKSEFQKRYGDKWKEVMYATATKSAKKVDEDYEDMKDDTLKRGAKIYNKVASNSQQPERARNDSQGKLDAIRAEYKKRMELRKQGKLKEEDDPTDSPNPQSPKNHADKRTPVEKERINVGDKIHMGLAVKGGAGFQGIVTKISGNEIHFRSETKGKFGYRTWKGQLKNAKKI